MATEIVKNSNSTDRGTPSDPPSAQEAQRRFSLKLQGYYHRLTEECNRSGEIQALSVQVRRAGGLVLLRRLEMSIWTTMCNTSFFRRNRGLKIGPILVQITP
ncbi:hypothetical protein [Chelatococcus asaccharovorans]|uniref:Uncharacterized protein n=1 Tax=Chelatococcus asaccharovorans TaxID=28210 RepID=A0A2V3TSG2_9HYPH|nr:hypothetical protein [Chelatococcus asaccharovorans]MBS7707819.1 hypothetical protein [Chelatococcus asaccharovorans]PXW50938.1 hypothetical protein C7450_12249 [Chelatococcus asaccharovorans]